MFSEPGSLLKLTKNCCINHISANPVAGKMVIFILNDSF